MGYTFLIGGARSGKSTRAVELARTAAERGQAVSFIVTAEALDDEMRSRIERHRQERPPDWSVHEAPRHLMEGILAATSPGPTVEVGSTERLPATSFVVVDCVSFWVANLVMDDDLDDREIETSARAVAALLAAQHIDAVVVSNEVGLGLVPDNPLGRRFRDVLGRVNVILAERAERACLVVAGRALELS